VLSLSVLEALGKSEINDINGIFCRLSASDEEVIRLDIPVNYPLFMDLLNARDHLDRN